MTVQQDGILGVVMISNLKNIIHQVSSRRLQQKFNSTIPFLLFHHRSIFSLFFKSSPTIRFSCHFFSAVSQISSTSFVPIS
ncbi:hypothetical protein L2E82_31452 [Cichorium intybus]|uniref:Uncharacterized protein n=1 Tax=Cichorium intybus TaxID=13427 RepID=A0ACB9D2Z8_CICIN|nr:hypothetical protein L2E82_31452 [Cichorium intybus]